jgi:hypothetical protein
VVRLKGTPFSGTVVRTKGVHAPRFRVLVTSSVTGREATAVTERRAARLASRWYGLDELESTGWPLTPVT